MASYKAFLPKTGGGGSDTIGSITRMSTTLDALVEIEGKTYMKEGYHLSDGPDTFPEAYEKLSGKDGKHWDGIIEQNLSNSYKFRGLFATEIGTLAIFTYNQEMRLYHVDPERSSMNLIHTYNVTTNSGQQQFRSHAIHQNGCIWIWLDSNYIAVIKPSDLGVINEHYIKPSGMTATFAQRGFPVGDKGILWATGNPATAYIYMEVERSAQISGTPTYAVFPTSMIQGSLMSGVQFTEIGGNVVTFMYTSVGEIVWHGGSGSLDDINNWAVRVNLQNLQDMGVYSLFRPKYMVASPSADLVYVGDINGAYFVTNGRGLGPEGALFNVEYAKFPALVSSQTSWSAVNNFIFFHPGAALGNYYRLNPTTRKWESFNYANKMRLNGDVEYPPSLCQNGTDMIHWGRENGLASNKYCVMVSSDKVMLPIDNTTEGGTSAYMRVK